MGRTTVGKRYPATGSGSGWSVRRRRGGRRFEAGPECHDRRVAEALTALGLSGGERPQRTEVALGPGEATVRAVMVQMG
jgi:hypothetical protein